MPNHRASTNGSMFATAGQRFHFRCAIVIAC